MTYQISEQDMKTLADQMKSLEADLGATIKIVTNLLNSSKEKASKKNTSKEKTSKKNTSKEQTSQTNTPNKPPKNKGKKAKNPPEPKPIKMEPKSYNFDFDFLQKNYIDKTKLEEFKVGDSATVQIFKDKDPISVDFVDAENFRKLSAGTLSTNELVFLDYVKEADKTKKIIIVMNLTKCFFVLDTKENLITLLSEFNEMAVVHEHKNRFIDMDHQLESKIVDIQLVLKLARGNDSRIESLAEEFKDSIFSTNMRYRTESKKIDRNIITKYSMIYFVYLGSLFLNMKKVPPLDVSKGGVIIDPCHFCKFSVEGTGIVGEWPDDYSKPLNKLTDPLTKSTFDIMYLQDEDDLEMISKIPIDFISDITIRDKIKALVIKTKSEGSTTLIVYQVQDEHIPQIIIEMIKSNTKIVSKRCLDIFRNSGESSKKNSVLLATSSPQEVYEKIFPDFRNFNWDDEFTSSQIVFCSYVTFQSSIHELVKVDLAEKQYIAMNDVIDF
ncbi:hypothetical protein TVAG_454190 [Trichomonas vaginalis G3]|uniref:Uncharacterized protein n=1 Tax=Trichomonas vaginalis (strain ATCC PRA-98 / G3) TaxID=412133 RepID=A2DPZ5_TRIV3|nr:hypothetical protein TVAGG3_0552720 [Trichomonas vaginalis G3]EAY17591.1 hypothetical protein TVAG_454190 [Trichomonas vaginalis G3]KAI5520635.1 hypothetical protein TVAGG3_0552720 [Trichomonas vaginalis G3]|eukprot:XP_001329726.1 hypothetical protein [Trichomonas vaginalis G3]